MSPRVLERKGVRAKVVLGSVSVFGRRRTGQKGGLLKFEDLCGWDQEKAQTLPGIGNVAGVSIQGSMNGGNWP